MGLWLVGLLPCFDRSQVLQIEGRCNISLRLSQCAGVTRQGLCTDPNSSKTNNTDAARAWPGLHGDRKLRCPEEGSKLTDATARLWKGRWCGPEVEHGGRSRTAAYRGCTSIKTSSSSAASADAVSRILFKISKTLTRPILPTYFCHCRLTCTVLFSKAVAIPHLSLHLPIFRLPRKKCDPGIVRLDVNSPSLQPTTQTSEPWTLHPNYEALERPIIQHKDTIQRS